MFENNYCLQIIETGFAAQFHDWKDLFENFTENSFYATVEDTKQINVDFQMPFVWYGLESYPHHLEF